MNSENDLIPADKIPPASLEKAFHLMWDHFPEPVSLIHKSKCVVAVNPACSSIGRTVGSICIKHGKPEAHKGCLALKALKKQTGMYRAGTFEKKALWSSGCLLMNTRTITCTLLSAGFTITRLHKNRLHGIRG